MKKRIKFTYAEILIMLAIAVAILTVSWSIVHYCFPVAPTGGVLRQSMIEETSKHVASPETIRLMEKHGPNYLYEIDKGIMYLHRDGRRIEVGRVR